MEKEENKFWGLVNAKLQHHLPHHNKSSCFVVVCWLMCTRLMRYVVGTGFTISP